MMHEQPCPLCGSRSEIEQSEQISVSDYGLLTLCYPVCEECGAELRPDEQDLVVLVFDLGRVSSV